MMRVAAIGECMLELSAAADSEDASLMRLGYGGDTLNTCVYLARLGHAVDYVTAIGDDAYSQWMLDQWQQQGLGTDLVTQLPNRVPGLYMIATDDSGERTFNYWRGESPARELFDEPARVERLKQALSQHELVYFSGITLSLYSAQAREQLFALLQALKNEGVKICFDGNYRPKGWPDKSSAQAAFKRASELSDIVLPTHEDEQLLFGDDSEKATIERIKNYGLAEIVLKLGPSGCRIVTDAEQVLVPATVVSKPVDTTAAGDSFNAAYLAGRLKGLTAKAAARWGHELAGQVIQHRGAIIAPNKMPVLTLPSEEEN